MPVSTDDVEIALGRDLTAAEEARAERLIEMAQAAIEDANPGFTFDAGTETATVYPAGDVAWTPKYPVRSVTSVTVDGLELGDGDWRVDELGRITPITRGDWVINLPEIGSIAAGVTIAYAYGFTTIPADLALVIAAQVAAPIRQGATNAGHVQSEQLGPYRVDYGDQAPSAGVLGPAQSLPKRWRRTPRSIELTR